MRLAVIVLAACMTATAQAHTVKHHAHRGHGFVAHGYGGQNCPPFDPAQFALDGQRLQAALQTTGNVLAAADARLRDAQAKAITAAQQLDAIIRASAGAAKRHPWQPRTRGHATRDATAEGMWPDDCSDIGSSERTPDCQ